MQQRIVPILLFLAVAGCAGSERGAVGPAPAALSPPTNENLHAVLWTQTAVEGAVVAGQAYELARIMLDRALPDTGWTAAIEQLGQPGYGSLPPAVVLDVDETVLDNSPYQARLVLSDAEYGRASWDAWVAEEAALPVPGALAFTRYAAERGVRVIYMTNRRSHLEAATRANLERLGFPVDPDPDAVLTRGEKPEWDGSDKGPRREAVARQYRILLLLGDNLGDFMSEVEVNMAARRALVRPFADYFGRRWIMLPNPQYGSWESALFDHDFSLGRAEKLRRKYGALDTLGMR